MMWLIMIGILYMIKIALKHWIYEKCINVLFDGIKKNFNLSRNYPVRVGEFYSTIIIKFDNERSALVPDPLIRAIYYNCVITDVNGAWFTFETTRIDGYNQFCGFSGTTVYNEKRECHQYIDSITYLSR